MYKYNKMEHTYHYKYKKYKSLYKMGGRDERLLDEVVDDDDEELESKTKLELEAIGRENGIELDRREKKSTLIDKLKGIIS